MRVFLKSPLERIIYYCLTQQTEYVSNETISLVLTDFPFYNENEELIVQNITVTEFLNSITTKITGTGADSPHNLWDGSVAFDYFTIFIDTRENGMYRPCDLKNAFNFVQAMAKLNGFEKMIPAIICDINIDGLLC